MAENIVRCLDDCFANNGLFISAHDADTEHVEGATYVWSYAELKDFLGQDEFKRFVNRTILMSRATLKALSTD